MKKTKVKLNGKVHERTEWENNVYYTLDNYLHREDNGPAVMFADKTFMWYKNGLLHREDGPAVESSYSGEVYYLNNEKYSKEEFDRLTSEKK